MPRPLTLASCRCPLCRCPVSPSDLRTHPTQGPLCDDCFDIVEGCDAIVLIPRTPIVVNFTDVSISPHCDTLESPSHDE